jgi:hypothetical protein
MSWRTFTYSLFMILTVMFCGLGITLAFSAPNWKFAVWVMSILSIPTLWLGIVALCSSSERDRYYWD